MRIDDKRNLVTSIVLLFRPDSLKTSFSVRDIQDLLGPPVTVGQLSDGRVLFSSVPDQVEVYLGPQRLDVRDLSGKDPGSKPIAKVVGQLREILGGTPRAVGINYELAIPVVGDETAGGLVARKLLAPRDANDGVSIDGAAITIYYHRNSRRCTLRIEPHRGDPSTDTVYVNINIHEDLSGTDEELSKRVEIGALTEAVVAEYQDFWSVLDRLLGGQ